MVCLLVRAVVPWTSTPILLQLVSSRQSTSFARRHPSGARPWWSYLQQARCKLIKHFVCKERCGGVRWLTRDRAGASPALAAFQRRQPCSSCHEQTQPCSDAEREPRRLMETNTVRVEQVVTLCRRPCARASLQRRGLSTSGALPVSFYGAKEEGITPSDGVPLAFKKRRQHYDQSLIPAPSGKYVAGVFCRGL